MTKEELEEENKRLEKENAFFIKKDFKLVKINNKLKGENAELKKKLEIAQNARGDWFGKAVTKDRQLTEANETLDYAKAIMRELLDNSNEYARQNAEDFIKE